MIERHEHRLERAGAVATITLERAAAYNALTRRLLAALSITLREVAEDGTIRAVVFTGSGKGFCAGQALDDADRLRLRLDRHALPAASVELNHPITQQPLRVEAPLPNDLRVFLDSLQRIG